MKETPDKINIRYLGFECANDGGRRLEFSLTSPGRDASKVIFEISSGAFSGNGRISFQESAAVCYEKLRDMIGCENSVQDTLQIHLTDQDIEQFRPRRRKAAAARTP